MLGGVTVHCLNPPDPACALSHLSARQFVLTHSPCLLLKPWGPPQVCCGFGAPDSLAGV